MLLNQAIIALAASVAFPVCSATKVLPRGRISPFEFPDVPEIYEVIVNISDRPDAVPLPRLRIPALPIQKHLISSESSSAKVKRTLLSARQSCQVNYGYCRASGRCCPNESGDGGCCDDGTCITSASTCCLNGGACQSGRDCCLNGCKPRANTCCVDNYSCRPGYDCCGNGHCAPKGGDCCSDGSACRKGLVCVTLNSVVGCCKDSTCTEFQAGGKVEDTGSEVSTLSDDGSSAASTSFVASSASTSFGLVVSATVVSNTRIIGPTSTSAPDDETDTAIETADSFTFPSVSSSLVNRISSTSSTVPTPARLTPTGSAGAASTSTTSTGNVAGSGSMPLVGPWPARRAWVVGLTAAAMAVGAEIVLL